MKKIVMYVDLDEELLNGTKKIKKYFDLNDVKIHLVHCHHVQTYMADMVIYNYPTEQQYKEIEDSTVKLLKQFSQEAEFKNASYHVLFDANPKDRCVKLGEDIKADIAVVVTRAKHGIQSIFESSFATYMNKYSSCDVLVLK